MSVWTVKPETVKIDLEYVALDGVTYPFSITIKKHLTVGEERRIITAGWIGSRIHGEKDDRSTSIDIDWKRQTFARAEIYLTAWSLTNDDGSHMPLSRDTIESLNPDVFALIEVALNKHVEMITEEKKLKTGGAKS